MFGNKTNKDLIKELNDELFKVRNQVQNMANHSRLEERIREFLVDELTKVKLKEISVRVCPFCGESPKVVTESSIYTKREPSFGMGIWFHEEEVFSIGYRVECKSEKCKVHPHTDPHETLEEAVKEWNGVE